METTYNELLSQFHHDIASNSFIAQYKRISSELVGVRRNKKQQLLAYRQDLALFQRNNYNSERTISKSKISNQTQLNQSGVTVLRLEGQSIDDADLKKKTSDLQREISVLRQKNRQLVSQLHLIQNKKQQFTQIEGDLQLGAFNRNQHFLIESTQIAKKERSQKQALERLKQRRHSLEEEIKGLVKEKDNQQELKKKWKISRQIKIISTQQKGLKIRELQNILRTLYFLVKLDKNNKIGGHFNKQQFLHDLLSTEDVLAMSRREMMNYFKEHGIEANQQQIGSIIRLYHEQEHQFDQNQRANKQISYSLQTLQVAHQKLNNTLHTLHEQKHNHTMRTLKEKQILLKRLQHKIKSNCIFIIIASTQLSQLIHKLQNFRKTLKQTLYKTKRQLLMELGGGCPTASSYRKLLSRNPEQIALSWIKAFGKQNGFYQQRIENNDILRIYAQPNDYNPSKEELQNYENTFTVSFERARTFMMQMFAELMSNLNEKCIFKGRKQDFSNDGDTFCVESKEYFRRDDYRLLQNSEKEQSNSLAVQTPINLNIENELMSFQRRNGLISSLSSSPRDSFAHLQMKYTNLATRREQSCRNTSTLRKMLSRLNSLNSSRSNKTRMPKSLLPFNCTISSPNICRTFRISRNLASLDHSDMNGYNEPDKMAADE